MQMKTRASFPLALVAATLALACGVALIPSLAFGTSEDAYNLTVGGTLVGEDSNKWQGEGQDRAYVYAGTDFSYAYYPATSTLRLNGGTVTGYYEYNDGTKDVEVLGVVSTNCVASGTKTLTSIDSLTIEVAQDTAVVVPQHAATNSDPSARAFTDSSLQTTVTATVCGPGTLTISTDGVLSSCGITGLMFDKVLLSADEPARIVFDSVLCSCNIANGSCSFTGIDGNNLVSIGQGSTVEFNDIKVQSAGNAGFTGISAREAVVESGAQVALHNLDYSCGRTAMIGYSYVALFHIYGNITCAGDILVAADAEDEMSVAMANASEDGSEKIIVAGISVDYQAGNANVSVSGTFAMNNVTISAHATTRPQEMGEVFLVGIHNGSRAGSTSLTNLGFTFNEYGKSSITIGGESNIQLAARAIDEYVKLEAKDSAFDITLPKVDATYLCDRSDVAGLMVCAGNMALTDSVIDVRYSEINLDDLTQLLGHAGLVAAGAVMFDGTSRCTVTCTQTGEEAGIEADAVTLAGDTTLEIQAPAGKPAIVKGLASASYDSIGEGSVPQDLGQLESLGTSNANIVRLAEGYKPLIAYGADERNATNATALAPEQYGDNAYFSIRNADYDYLVRFDSLGGSAVDTQTVHNLALAQRPSDPVRAGYVLEGWCTDAECTQPYDFDTPVTGDVTLYAKWKAEGAVPATGDADAPTAGFALAAGLAALVLAGAAFARRKAKPE